MVTFLHVNAITVSVNVVFVMAGLCNYCLLDIYFRQY